MDEPLISDRLKFKQKGDQKDFISRSRELLNLTWVAFAKKLNVSTRTLASWRGEKLHMSFECAKEISKLTKIKIPKDFVIIKWNTHLKNISTKGGKANFAKYGYVVGDEIKRKERWQKWWKEIGQYKEIAKGYQSLIEIHKPKKSKELAEFVGIMLGDGGVNKYHTTVTLSNKETQYALYVTNLIKELFDIKPKIYKSNSAEAVSIVIQRKEMVNFCKSIGLVQGNKIKQQIDIPVWVKENKNFLRECIRGLVDTDGCFYINTYKVNGKKYSYFKIAFISASFPLVKSFSESLEKFGIKTVIDKKKRDVRIVETDSVNKYIKEFYSHNEKHLEKIKKWKNNENMLK